MATLRYDPFRRWGWIRWGFPRRELPQGSIEEYQAPDELALSACGRHAVVLIPAVVTCCGVVVLGWQTQVRVALLPLAAVFLVWRIWRWRVTCYVLTNRRLLFVDGIVYTTVEGVPLIGVVDVTHRQSIFGRLLGYGDLTLTLEGPAERKLRTLGQADVLYALILRQIAVRDETATT